MVRGLAGQGLFGALFGGFIRGGLRRVGDCCVIDFAVGQFFY